MHSDGDILVTEEKINNQRKHPYKKGTILLICGINQNIINKQTETSKWLHSEGNVHITHKSLTDTMYFIYGDLLEF